MAKKLGEIYIDITGRLAKLKGTMARGKRLIVGWSKNLTKWMKRGGIAIGIGLVAALSLAVKAAIAFEQQMAKVATMLSETTMKYLPKFGRAIKDLSIKFGEGTRTITEALYQILSASIAVTKAIKVLRVSIIAAKGGFTDTATAANVITTALNAYGIAAKDAMKVSDKFLMVQKRGKTSLAEFAIPIGKVLGLAAALGVPLEEVNAALSTLTRNGINTAEAITGIRGALVALTGKSVQGMKIAEDYGIELSASALAMDGLVGMTKKLSKVTPDVMGKIISETEALTVLSVMTGDLTGLTGDLKAQFNAAGESMRAQSIVSATLGEKFKALWQTIKAFASDMGDTLMPMIKDAVDSLIEKLGSLRDEFNALWYGVDGDLRKFLGILFRIVSVKMGQFAKDMGVYGKRAANSFIDEYGKRMRDWVRDKTPGSPSPKWFGPFRTIGKKFLVKRRRLEKEAEAERISADRRRAIRLKTGYDAELQSNKELADAKIKTILEAAKVEEGRQYYLTRMAMERADREREEADDKIRAAEEETSRLEVAEKKRTRLAKRLADERKQALKDSAEEERKLRIEKLQKLKAMYASMKGYETEYRRVQRRLWKEQAEEYAKTGLITAEAAEAGLIAKGTKEPLGRAGKEAAGGGFVAFQQMWSNIARQLIAKHIEQQQLKAQEEAVRQLQNVNRGIGILTSEVKNLEIGVFTE